MKQNKADVTFLLTGWWTPHVTSLPIHLFSVALRHMCHELKTKGKFKCLH